MHPDPSLPFTLVMLHGLLGDRDDWQALGEALEHAQPGVRCLALNLPGHGQPTTPAVGSFADFHDWLSGTLVEAGVGRYGLLGYSLGGRLALYHASQRPAGLEALWLESAHPGLAAPEREARRAHDEHWAQRFEQSPLADVLTAWYQQPVFADLTASQRQRQIQCRLANHGPAVAHMLRATSLGRQPSLWQWLAETDLPVGYFSGLRDHKFNTLANRLTQHAPRLRHWALPGGHNLHVEHPKAMAGHLSQQLAQHLAQTLPR
ncbi:2-succinyl-6-hydroxy-2,4-cyclohexadiene-1-carboxylate synthase [Halomonas sp. KM072]